MKSKFSSYWSFFRQKFLRESFPIGFFTNLSWQYSESTVGMVFGFLYTLLVGRLLGPSEFGLMALGLSFSALVFQIIELRLHESLIRYVAEFWEKGDSNRTLAVIKLSFIADITTGIIALIVVFLLSSFAQVHLIRDPRGSLILTLSALTIFSGNIATVTSIGILRVFSHFKPLALVRSSGIVLRFLLTLLGLLIFNLDVIGVLIIHVISSSITNLVLTLLALKELNSRIPLMKTNAPIRLLAQRKNEIGRFAWNTYLLSLTKVPIQELDVIVLGWLTSHNVVGVYKVAKNFAIALWTMADSVYFVVYPEIAKLWTKRKINDLSSFVKRLTVLVGAVGSIAFSITFLIVPYFIQLIMGQEYAQAGILFRWMSWGILVWAPLIWVPPLLAAADRPDLNFKSSLIVAMATFALLPFTVVSWGATGAALVYALKAPLLMTLLLSFGKRAGIIFPITLTSSGSTAGH